MVDRQMTRAEAEALTAAYRHGWKMGVADGLKIIMRCINERNMLPMDAIRVLDRIARGDTV